MSDPRLPSPVVGENLKVWLPGESPWAIVLAVLPDGRVLGRLNNDLIREGHGYKFGDVATFEPELTSDYAIWMLAPIDQQLKMGPSRSPAGITEAADK